VWARSQRRLLVKNRYTFVLLLTTALFQGCLFASTVELAFTTLPANTQNGTYNGFVGGTINGVSFDDLICDDYGHTTYVPSTGLKFDLYTIADFSKARFGGAANALENYQDAALLVYSIENLAAVNTYLPKNQQLNVADLQYALWDLFTPGSGNTANSANALLLLSAAAPQLSLPGDLASSLRIYVPANSFGSNQEFLEVQETVPVHAAGSPSAPEPAALGIAIAGLLVIGGMVATGKVLRG
jgi:hypothetical protein